MPQLNKDQRACLVNSIGYFSPCFCLFARPNTRRINPPDSGGRNVRTFAYDQASTGSLLIIFSHCIVWHSLCTSSGTSHWRHYNSVFQSMLANLYRFKKIRDNCGHHDSPFIRQSRKRIVTLTKVARILRKCCCRPFPFIFLIISLVFVNFTAILRHFKKSTIPMDNWGLPES